MRNFTKRAFVLFLSSFIFICFVLVNTTQVSAASDSIGYITISPSSQTVARGGMASVSISATIQTANSADIYLEVWKPNYSQTAYSNKITSLSGAQTYSLNKSVNFLVYDTEGGSYTYNAMIAIVNSGSSYGGNCSGSRMCSPKGFTITVPAAPKYSISGRVTGSDGSSIYPVRINYSGTNTGSVQASSDGSYAIPNLPTGSYRIFPSKTDYSFNPAARDLTLNQDYSGINFTANADPKLYSIFGYIKTSDGQGVSSVQVSCSGSASKSSTTDGSGYFSIPSLPIGSYSCTPTNSSYNFSPTSISTNISNIDREISFTASVIIPPSKINSVTVAPTTLLRGDSVKVTAAVYLNAGAPGYLQVKIGSTATNGIAISSAGSNSYNVDLYLNTKLMAQGGSILAVSARFRPGVTSGPLNDSKDIDATFDVNINFTVVGNYYKVSNPAPIDGQTMVSLTPAMNWSANNNPAGTTYKIYLGTSSGNMTFQQDVTSAIFYPSKLNLNTKYYWRVDVAEANGEIITGDVWSFTTIGAQPPFAEAGPDQSVTEGTTVTLDASASRDTDGQIVSYKWQEGEVVLAGQKSLSRVYDVGIHTITLIVKDNDNLEGRDTVKVTVSKAAPSFIVISGKMEYLSDSKKLPIRFATIELWSKGAIIGPDLVTNTDAFGNYSFKDVPVGKTYTLKLVATSSAVEVITNAVIPLDGLPIGGNVYSEWSADIIAEKDKNVTMSLVAQNPKPFFIMDNIIYAYGTMIDKVGYKAAKIQAYWPTSHTYANQSFNVAQLSLGTKIYIDDNYIDMASAIVHEYGHDIMIQLYGWGQGAGYDHSPGKECKSAEDAFGEGWADFFPSMIFDNAWKGAFGYMESNSFGQFDKNASQDEGAVASAMWDVYDSALTPDQATGDGGVVPDNIDDDKMAAGFAKLFNFIRGQKPTNITDFYNKWIKLYSTEESALRNIYIDHYILSNNYPPILHGPLLIPNQGTTNDLFVYKVAYDDPEKLPPAKLKIYIDNVGHDMILDKYPDYKYETKLAKGDHQYYFIYSDGVNPEYKTEVFTGPQVIQAEPTPNGSYKLGNVTVYADKFTRAGLILTATGNVRINDYISLDQSGSVVIGEVKATIDGSGIVTAKNFGKVFKGDFSVDKDSGILTSKSISGYLQNIGRYSLEGMIKDSIYLSQPKTISINSINGEINALAGAKALAYNNIDYSLALRDINVSSLAITNNSTHIVIIGKPKSELVVLGKNFSYMPSSTNEPSKVTIDSAAQTFASEGRLVMTGVRGVELAESASSKFEINFKKPGFSYQYSTGLKFNVPYLGQVHTLEFAMTPEGNGTGGPLILDYMNRRIAIKNARFSLMGAAGLDLFGVGFDVNLDFGNLKFEVGAKPGNAIKVLEVLNLDGGLSLDLKNFVFVGTGNISMNFVQGNPSTTGFDFLQGTLTVDLPNLRGSLTAGSTLKVGDLLNIDLGKGIVSADFKKLIFKGSGKLLTTDVINGNFTINSDGLSGSGHLIYPFQALTADVNFKTDKNFKTLTITPKGKLSVLGFDLVATNNTITYSRDGGLAASGQIILPGIIVADSKAISFDKEGINLGTDLAVDVSGYKIIKSDGQAQLTASGLTGRGELAILGLVNENTGYTISNRGNISFSGLIDFSIFGIPISSASLGLQKGSSLLLNGIVKQTVGCTSCNLRLNVPVSGLSNASGSFTGIFGVQIDTVIDTQLAGKQHLNFWLDIGKIALVYQNSEFNGSTNVYVPYLNWNVAVKVKINSEGITYFFPQPIGTIKVKWTDVKPILPMAPVVKVMPTNAAKVPVKVELKPEAANTSIFYTLDGSLPSIYSKVYDGAIDIVKAATLRFFAISIDGRPTEYQYQKYSRW